MCAFIETVWVNHVYLMYGLKSEVCMYLCCCIVGWRCTYDATCDIFVIQFCCLIAWLHSPPEVCCVTQEMGVLVHVVSRSREYNSSKQDRGSSHIWHTNVCMYVGFNVFVYTLTITCWFDVCFVDNKHYCYTYLLHFQIVIFLLTCLNNFHFILGTS